MTAAGGGSSPPSYSAFPDVYPQRPHLFACTWGLEPTSGAGAAAGTAAGGSSSTSIGTGPSSSPACSGAASPQRTTPGAPAGRVF